MSENISEKMNDQKLKHPKDSPTGEVYGSFYLAEDEFAVPVSRVQEVVNSPGKFTSMPLAPAYMRGLFHLRGLVVPVVDLRSLLSLPPAESEHTEPKIAILEMHGHRIGILFEKTGEVFRSHPDERCDFNDSSAASVVRGVFKRDGGKRLIQILDVDRLMGLEALPQQTDRAVSEREQSHLFRRGARRQCISFSTGPAVCALGIDEIQEILKVDKINGSALAVDHCIGTIDLRGTTVPVLDFPALLGYRPTLRSQACGSGERRIMVMRVEKECFGLLVDSVESIVSYFADELKSFPVLSTDRMEMFKGCISLPGDVSILLLDGTRILKNQEILEVTRGHSKLYNVKESQGQKASAGTRRTFITFSLGCTYAVPISDVREIIDEPPTLLRPPGLPDHCKGVLNLRGEMVVILSGRELHSKTPLESPGKVLILKSGTFSFGLVVDDVEEIAVFSDAEKIKLPEMLSQGQGAGSIVSEAFQVKDANNQGRSVLIMSVSSIQKRIGFAA